MTFGGRTLFENASMQVNFFDLTLEDALHDVTDTALTLLPCDHASIRLFDTSRTRKMHTRHPARLG